MNDTATQAAQDDNPEISVTKDATDSIFQKVNRLFVLSFENKQQNIILKWLCTKN